METLILEYFNIDAMVFDNDNNSVNYYINLINFDIIFYSFILIVNYIIYMNFIIFRLNYWNFSIFI